MLPCKCSLNDSMSCPVTVVRVMLKHSKGTLGKRGCVWFLFVLFCFTVCWSLLHGIKEIIPHVTGWKNLSVLWKHLFLQRILEQEIKQCFAPECLYGLIVEGLILTALCMLGPSFWPGGRFSPRGVTGGLRTQVIEKVCPCSGSGISSPTLPTGYRSVFCFMV